MHKAVTIKHNTSLVVGQREGEQDGQKMNLIFDLIVVPLVQ
jgi:hypothetical protein